MKLDRINYQKTFNLGNYTSERIGMEAQIDDGENVQEKLLVLKNLVEDFHEKNNPGVLGDDTPPPGSEGNLERIRPSYRMSDLSPIPSIDRKAIDDLEIAIDNAETLDDLYKLRTDVAKYSKHRDGLIELFNKRLSEISPSDTTTIN